MRSLPRGVRAPKTGAFGLAVRNLLKNGGDDGTESGLFNTSGCVPCQGAHRLHHYQPDVVRPLHASGHKN